MTLLRWKQWLYLETTLRSLCRTQRRAKRHGSGCRSFFKSLLRCGILLQMKRPWLQPRQLQQAQPLDHRSLMHLDRETLLNFVAQINAAPADNLVRLRIRSVDDLLLQRRLLSLIQQRRRAGGRPGRKAPTDPRRCSGAPSRVTSAAPSHFAALPRSETGPPRSMQAP